MKCTIISSCCSILVRDLSYGSEEIFLIDKIEKENNVTAARVQQSVPVFAWGSVAGWPLVE